MKKKKDMTRKEIVMQTALEMISEGGFHASPMAELAARSGVAIGTIYHHFPSKEELMVALYNDCAAHAAEVITNAAAGSGTFKDKTARIWADLFAFFQKNPLEFSFLDQFGSSPLAAESAKKGASAGAPLVAFFKAGLKDNKVRKADAEVMADFVHGSVATALRGHFSGRKKIAKKDIESLQEMAWAAVKK
jgi:TetR/AcrR family transcriptional regulator, multidrug resistance operon repressor